MMITVAICTLNRAESLRRTLESLAAMRVPNGLGWEVVVVNNGSL
jgi:glycosyltransferase involved in cell wall biosynthesis